MSARRVPARRRRCPHRPACRCLRRRHRLPRIDHRPARGVDQVGPVPSSRAMASLSISSVSGLIVERAVQRDDVALLEQLVQRDKLDAVRLLAGEVALVAQHPAAEGAAELCCAAADGPRAHDAEPSWRRARSRQGRPWSCRRGSAPHLRDVARSSESIMQTASSATAWVEYPAALLT